MQTTTHYGLKKPDGNDTYDVANDNANMDAIDAQMYANAQAAATAQTTAQANAVPYVADTSTNANTLIVTLTPAPAAYTDGMPLCVKVANTTTGAATLNVNGLGAIAIKNGDGTPMGSGDLVAGVPVTLRYVTGASPAFIASGSGGLSGAGTAVAANVLTGKTFTSSTAKAQQGSMPNNGTWNATPGPNPITVPLGYHSGAGAVSAVTFDATKVLTGTTIAGTAGAMPNEGAPTWTPSTVAQALAAGYYSGGTVQGSSDLLAQNIILGKNIFGVAGSAYRVAQGTAQNTYNSTGAYLEVHGLSFQPKFVYAAVPASNGIPFAFIDDGTFGGSGKSGYYMNVNLGCYTDSDSSFFPDGFKLCMDRNGGGDTYMQNVFTWDWVAVG